MGALRLIVLFSIMYVAQRLPGHVIAHLLCIILVLPVYGRDHIVAAVFVYHFSNIQIKKRLTLIIFFYYFVQM